MRTALLVAALALGSLAMAPAMHAQTSGTLRAVARVYRPPRDRESLVTARAAVRQWMRDRRPGTMVRKDALAQVTLTIPTPASRPEDSPGALLVDIQYLRN